MKRFVLVFWLLHAGFAMGQNTVEDNAALLKILLTKYYSNEKPIVKDF